LDDSKINKTASNNITIDELNAPDEVKGSQTTFDRGLRKRTPLDIASVFDSMNQERSAEQNMKSYMDNFGIQFNLPSLYVKDAKIYPADPRYNLQVINHCFPIEET
jgi:hypothetical protein